jgi:hypothetical protein
MINSLGVMPFWTQSEISVLSRFEYPENFRLLSLVQVQSQKTSNTKLIVNYLNFPVISHTSKSGNREEVVIVGTQRTSGRILNTNSDSNWWWSRETLLTEFGVESGEMNNTKLVDNFDIFPDSTDTPSYDQWIRSYDLCNLGCCWNFQFSRQIKLPRQIWTLSLLPLENWKSHEYKGPR